MLGLISASMLLASAPVAPAPLNGEALRRLLLNGYHTYLKPALPDGIIIDHPSFEIFKPSGTYSAGDTILKVDEGRYTIEGDQLCVAGDRIPKRCRRVFPQGGDLYLLIDVANGSKAAFKLRQVK